MNSCRVNVVVSICATGSPSRLAGSLLFGLLVGDELMVLRRELVHFDRGPLAVLALEDTLPSAASTNRA
jgi:hypothetical protein